MNKQLAVKAGIVFVLIGIILMIASAVSTPQQGVETGSIRAIVLLNDTPQEGATVIVSNQTWNEEKHTNKNGEALFTVSAGTYNVYAKATLGDNDFESTQTIEIQGQEIKSVKFNWNYDIGLLETARVDVYVTIDGQPTKDAVCKIYDGFNLYKYGETDSTGHWATKVQPGYYKVMVNYPGFSFERSIEVAKDDIKTVTVEWSTPGPSPTPPPQGKGGLRVICGFDVQGSYVPVRGAEVTVYKDGAYVDSGLTDNNGQWTTSLDYGTYQVKAFYKTGVLEYDWYQYVTVETGKTTQVIVTWQGSPFLHVTPLAFGGGPMFVSPVLLMGILSFIFGIGLVAVSKIKK